MKLFFILFFIPFIIFSQTGKVTYGLVLNFDGLNNKQSKIDLFFTHSKSLFTYQFNQNDTPKLKNEEIKKKNDEVNISVGVENDPVGNLYLNDLSSGTFTCREAVFEDFKMKFYKYKDDLGGKIKWDLKDEFKTISNYKCQKAVGNFRGRTYEAWFTSEIPLSFGPWKLAGLPGLILEVYDLKHEIYYTAEKIEIPFEKAIELVNISIKDGELSHKEFVDRNRQVSERLSKAVLARLPEGSKISSIERKGDAIELEYEWEKE